MKKTLAIDIDETICDTRRYWFAKLSERYGAPEQLSVDEIIERYQYTHAVNHWKHADAQAHLREMRFDPEIHRHHLQAMPGASDGVRALSSRFDIIYMTMRPDSLIEATAYWLNNNNFPHGQIVASPADLHDNQRALWKGVELSQRFPQTIGLVDDHPDVARAIPAGYRGHLFLLGQSEAPREDIKIQCCSDWSAVLHSIERTIPREIQL